MILTRKGPSEVYNSALMHSRPSFQNPPKIRHCTFINVSFHRINLQFSHVPICDFVIRRFIRESEMNSFHVMEKFLGFCPFIWSKLPFLPCGDDADDSIPAKITDAARQHTHSLGACCRAWRLTMHRHRTCSAHQRHRRQSI